MTGWSSWRRFPDPRAGGLLTAPFGPGCYELRLGSELVLFGSAAHVARRMLSLLPAPLGCTRRENSRKRAYVLKHLGEIEYRTRPCADKAAARACESALRRANRGRYRFAT
jgi:hypothetical protein